MLKALKHLFIPHEGNDHRPYLLRNEMTLALIVITVIAQVLVLGQYWQAGTHGLLGEISSSVLVSETNEERSMDGLGMLATNAQLQAAAQAKADSMAAEGYFAHQSPDGSTPWTWIKNAGYHYSYAGENLAVNFVDSQDVTQAWMNSPEHRANILNGHYTQVGIATAQGMYKGKMATFVVQMFGTPAASAPVAVVAEPVKAAPAAAKPAETAPVQAAPAKPAAGQVAAAKTRLIPHAQVVAPATSTEATPTIETASTPLPIAVAQAQETSSTPPTGPSAKSILLTFYALLAALVGVAVILKLMKVRVRHPQLILNGVLVLVLIAGLAWLSEYATLAHALIG